MVSYFRRRLLAAIPVFFGITLIVYLMLSAAPGSIADLMSAGRGTLEEQKALQEALGLDRPAIVRYLAWLEQMLRGNLGRSYAYGQPVEQLIAQRFGATLLLTGSGVALSVVLAVPLGVLAAERPGSGWDRASGVLAAVSFSVPGFFLCILGTYLFAVVLKILPAFGMAGQGGGVRHLILPAGVIALSNLGVIVKQTKNACLEVRGEPYLRALRAKGLSPAALRWRHVLRGAMLPILTAVLSHIPHVIGGSLIVEQVFGWPGMGSLMFSAIGSRDYPVVMGITVLTALAVLATNLLLDLLYGLLDPRIRYEGGRRT